MFHYSLASTRSEMSVRRGKLRQDLLFGFLFVLAILLPTGVFLLLREERQESGLPPEKVVVVVAKDGAKSRSEKPDNVLPVPPNLQEGKKTPVADPAAVSITEEILLGEKKL